VETGNCAFVAMAKKKKKKKGGVDIKKQILKKNILVASDFFQLK
jgi:hypothetical protein